MSSFDGGFWGPEKEVVVGDLGAPKADMNDKTMQGVSKFRDSSLSHGSPLERPILAVGVVFGDDLNAPNVQARSMELARVRE